MSEPNDETVNFALLVVAALLSLVLAGVIGMAVSKGTRPLAKVRGGDSAALV